MRPQQGILPNGNILVLHRIGIGRLTYMSYLTALHILLWRGGPVGPEVIEPLELLVLDHADPAGQHAVIRNTTSLIEHPLARLESSLGSGLVERISDGEPAARQVPDTTLDSRLREGNTYLEHPAPGCPWTVDQWRGCRVWNHWSSQFFIHRGLHNLVNVS